MEEQINALRTQVESQARQITAIKDAMVNLVGFYVDEVDGSQQGLIKFGSAPVQVEAQPITSEVVG